MCLHFIAVLPLWRCGRPQTQQRCWSCSLPYAAAGGGTATRLVRRCPRAWWSVEWRSPRRWAPHGLRRPRNPAQPRWCDLWRTCVRQRQVTWPLSTIGILVNACLIKVWLTIKCCQAVCGNMKSLVTANQLNVCYFLMFMSWASRDEAAITLTLEGH